MTRAAGATLPTAKIAAQFYRTGQNKPLDASLIDLSVSLFPWATAPASKAAMKLQVGLNHGTGIPEFVAIGDGKQSELIAVRQFAFPEVCIGCCVYCRSTWSNEDT